jgi:hypothetical protein
MKSREKDEKDKKNYKELLFNHTISSESKVKEIVSNPDHLDQMQKCLKQSNPEFPIFRSNIIKISFKSLKSDFDNFNNLFKNPRVEIDAVEELLSDFLVVESIKEIDQNVFEVELEDKSKAQLAYLAFDGMELDDLGLGMQVKEVQLKIKQKLKKKKTFQPFIGIFNKMGIKTDKSPNFNPKEKNRVQIRQSQKPVLKNPMLPLMQQKFPYGIMDDNMRNFQNRSFNGNMMQVQRFPNNNMDFRRMQYPIIPYNMINSRPKSQLTIPKKTYEEPPAKIPYTLQETHLPGIVLIPSGKNKPNTNKFTCRYKIMIDNDKYFQVAKRIIGSKGCNMKAIIDSVSQEYSHLNQDPLKLRLRGKGSGFKEGPDQRESIEPLHLCISAKSESVYLNSCKKVENLLNMIYEDYLIYLENSFLEEDFIKFQNSEKFKFQKFEGNSQLFFN